MAIISIYAIKGIDKDADWTEAWKIVEASNSIDEARLKNVLESEASVDDEIVALRTACERRTELTEHLLREREATHAFVKPVKGKPVFGISLSNLFE